MASLDPAVRTFLVLAALALALLFVYWLLAAYARAFRRVGFTPGEASAIVTLSLLGGLINIPLFEAAGWRFYVNVGGAVVPIIVCGYLVTRQRVPFNEALVGVILVTAVTYFVTDFDPELGVSSRFPLWLLPSFTAFAVSAAAFWHDNPHAASLAYVSGTLGALIGADALHLPDILSSTPAEENRLSIGGASVFDMVFLTGILAIGLDAMLLSRRREERLTTPSADIDREFERWIAAKKAQQPARERAKDTTTQYREAKPLRASSTSPVDRIPFRRRSGE